MNVFKLNVKYNSHTQLFLAICYAEGDNIPITYSAYPEMADWLNGRMKVLQWNLYYQVPRADDVDIIFYTELDMAEFKMKYL